MMKKLEEAQAYFQGDRFATENGAKILELGEDYAICEMQLEDRHRNALGAVMGGAVFTLADFAFAVASNFGKKSTVSTTSQITFLRSAKGNTLYARAQEVRSGRTSVYYEVSVTDDTGALVARVTASGQIIG
jgi:acyl-CoA thioesterase